MLLDLLLPRRCAACGVPGVDACAGCVAALPRLRAPLCDRCGAMTAWPVRRCRECAGRRLAFVSARAAVLYDARVRAFVAGWKERGLRRLAAVAADVVADALPFPGGAALVPVPPDPERALRRGRHPAGELAGALAELWPAPAEALLVRPRAGPRQRGSSIADRRANVRGAFAATARPPPRVILVDDVYTTGATASAAASALRGAGAREVRVVTLARAVRLR